MLLTHKCPNCGKEHEHPTTPEPDKLCPVCELVEKRIVDAYLPIKMWINNNVFTRETCVLCHDSFKASMTLYELPIGYVCPDCAEDFGVKTEISPELIRQAQEQTFNLMLGPTGQPVSSADEKKGQ